MHIQTCPDAAVFIYVHRLILNAGQPIAIRSEGGERIYRYPIHLLLFPVEFGVVLIRDNVLCRNTGTGVWAVGVIRIYGRRIDNTPRK